MQISYEDFSKVDVRVGTVLSVKNNKKARQPALVVEVDFGVEIGIKKIVEELKELSKKHGTFYEPDPLLLSMC